ncbi:cupredoxin domain-containing protein [Cohnella zeiphila]|uniref:Cupredoxin domain-containing protein n=1 Tax=Cohnella zeiphila TaxID=2761120 RepID=A0A7X0SJM7_9BACL|nr:cupredoxin domain-containing protein [Cohnella zeiphila]MBB6731111.1 cupredoxin domain-containing protein [Cohnella zeiphila]
MHKKWAILLTAAALALALSACGGSGSNGNNTSASDSSAPAATAASEQLVVKASNWQFDKTEYTIPKDTPVEIKLVSEEGAHGLQIKDAGVKLSNAKTSQIVTLKAGTYEMKCDIVCGTGHLNMTAKLIVQ